MDYQVLRGTGDESQPCIYCINSRQDSFHAKSAVFSRNVTTIHLYTADWNNDLSPWPAKRLFKGQPADFGGQATSYLRSLVQEIIPIIEQDHGLFPSKRGMIGYSLAGLFALFALTKTDFFEGVACVSGSLWFDDWVAYLKTAVLPSASCFAYLSLGDKESAVRNTRMQTVEECTKETVALLKNKGLDVEYQQNSGSHFDDTNWRLQRAVEALERNLCATPKATTLCAIDHKVV